MDHAEFDMYLKTIKEVEKTREELEYAKQERDALQQGVTYCSLYLPTLIKTFRGLWSYVVHASSERVQSLVKCTMNGMSNTLNSKSTTKLQKLKTLVETVERGYNLNDGPFVKGIAESLDAIGMHRQKSYGAICLWESCAQNSAGKIYNLFS